MNTNTTSSARLQNLFDALNKQFFQGRLPRYRVKLWDSLPPHGQCVTEHNLILLRPMEPQQLRQVLLHEMCHIGEPGHGRRFQAKLERLLAQGEDWASDEIKAYREAASWNLEMANLRSKLDEIAYLSPRWRFQSLLQWTAMDLGMAPLETRKKVPWLEASWRKACRQADEDKRLRAELHRRRLLTARQGGSATPHNFAL